jgi:hypothetical protein
VHRAVPAFGQVRRPCVFCDEIVLQAQGRLATNDVTKKTGIGHEHCWEADQLRKHETDSAKSGA